MDDPVVVNRVGAWITITLAAALGALIVFDAVRPMTTAAREAGAFRRAVNILESAEGSLTSLRDEVEAVSREIERSEALLPERLNLDAFLSNLEEIAGEAGVRVENLRPGQVNDRHLFREFRVDLRVIGTFLDVYDFISTLERTNRLARIERLSMVGSLEDQCAADLRVILYYSSEVEGGES